MVTQDLVTRKFIARHANKKSCTVVKVLPSNARIGDKRSDMHVYGSRGFFHALKSGASADGKLFRASRDAMTALR